MTNRLQLLEKLRRSVAKATAQRRLGGIQSAVEHCARKNAKEQYWQKALRCGADVQGPGAAASATISDEQIEYQIRDRYSFCRFGPEPRGAST